MLFVQEVHEAPTTNHNDVNVDDDVGLALDDLANEIENSSKQDEIPAMSPVSYTTQSLISSRPL